MLKSNRNTKSETIHIYIIEVYVLLIEYNVRSAVLIDHMFLHF